ncbi:autophagy- protein 2 [Arthrobotrys megalospora]
MLGYIPRAVQLKLFRYALSKLDFLDHSTYDVERDFNLSLGLKNELEMKNLGLNVTKLSATLNLPPSIRLHDAKVSALHIRIPADFHRAPVRVSISTVIIDGEILDDVSTADAAGEIITDGLAAPDRSQHDPDIRDGFKIPSGIDLTSSFLQERPSEAREVDAVLQSNLDDRTLSAENYFEEEDQIDDSGLGTPLSLWNFVPSFFQRLVDRVEIAIKDISLRVKIPCPPEPLSLDVDYLTVIFSISSIEIEGVSAGNDDTRRDATLPRTTKPGMRAVRLDGIALSLSGYPEFFQDLSSFVPLNPEDTDTVTSGSTVLPSAAAPASSEVVRSTNLEDSGEIQPTTSTSSSDPNLSQDRTENHEYTKTVNRSFFAQMQEPNEIYSQLPPSPSTGSSRHPLFSPGSSFHGSIKSEEISSGILSRSFLHPESDHGLSQLDSHLDASNTEYGIHGLGHSQNIESSRERMPFRSHEDESDNDSLENEPRHFDLFQEPNTKFLGVIPTAAPQTTDSGFDLRVRSRTPDPNESGNSLPHIAEPVPRPAPLMTISQTLSNLEPLDATLEPVDEYTYYQETADSIEYSNPDLLYLSRSIYSPVSSISNDENQEQGNLESSEVGNTIGDVPVTQTEPQVIYASSDEGELSGSNSVYESYPPSEADDVPSFILGTPSLDRTAAEDNSVITPLPIDSGDQATLNLAESLGPGTFESSSETNSQCQIRSDADQQKVPRDTAILMQSQVMSSPLGGPEIPTQAEEPDNQARLAEESGSEGSESVLAESMIFTHEEAGSLYLSALGGSQPFGPSLPALVEQNETAPSTPSPDTDIPRIKIQKHVFRIDYIDIFVPGIAPSTDSAMEGQDPEATSALDAMSESTYPTMPGAFSVYAASRSERKRAIDPLAASHSARLKPKSGVSFKLFEDNPPGIPKRHTTYNHQTPTPVNRMELEIGSINVTIDLIVGRKLATIFTTTRIQWGTDSPGSVHKAPKVDDAAKGNSSDILLSATSLNITLVDRMPEDMVPPGCQKVESESPSLSTYQNSLSNPGGAFRSSDILVVSMNTFIIKHRINDTAGTLTSFSEVSLGSCLVQVGGQDVMKFLQNQKTSRSVKERVKNVEPVFVLRVEDGQEQRHIHIQSSIINFYFPVQDLEATLAYFGGLESMLNITPASSLSSKGQNLQRPGAVRNTESRVENSAEKQTYLTADVRGITIEVFVSSVAGGIGLSTYPIKITTNDTGGLAANLSRLAIFGPNIGESGDFGSESPVLELRSIDITLDSSPTEEDLERLLKMIMPSTDGYDDDDSVMVDILLRQRRRGSVLRINIGQTNGHVSDLADISRFKAVAGELGKMATVAKYIPQDERPGMLTLISAEGVLFTLFPEDGMQSFKAGLKDLDICHVAAPSLFALSIRKVYLTKQPKKLAGEATKQPKKSAEEVWVGESLPHYLAVSNHKHKNRSMVKVRMIGDEPEPEIKIKIWNTRFEYHAESFLELLSLTPKDTPDVVATSMVNSIANLVDIEPPSLSKARGSSQDRISSPNPAPLRLNIGLSGVSVALNPLNGDSKALFIVHDGNFISELSGQQPFSASLVLLKANLVAIDNQNNLTSPQRQSLDGRKQKQQLAEELSHYTSQGYVSVLTATSAKVHLKIDSDDAEGETTMFVNVEDVFIFIESCADSTQTVIEILNGMKPPLPESEEIKYLTQILPVDVLAHLDENAFMPMGNALIGGQPRDLKSLEEMPEDLFEDEIPFNSQLIESYYPSSDLPNANLPSVSTSPTSRPIPNNFHEQVCVVAEEPLTFDDHYIQAPSKEPQEAQIKIVPRKVALKVCVRNTQLIWNLHDGYDWQKTRDTISKAIRKVEERASRRRRRHADMQRALEEDEEEDEEEEEGDEESATYDVLFNSIYITLPLHRDPKDLSKEIQNQIKGNYDLQSETGSYTPTVTTLDSHQPPGSRNPQTRRRDQRYQRSKRNAMQFELKGVDVDFTIFEPDGLETQTSLDVRVNDVQVTENVRTSTWRMFLTYMREAGVRERGLPMAHIHVDTLRPVPELAATELSIKVKLLPLRLYVDQDALEFLTRFFEFKDPDNLKPGVKQEEPFIQRCEIDTVRVKLDFKPKRVDYAGLRSGRTTEFMNFFILEEADMELRHVALNGVSGFERLGKDLNNIWMPDIKQNQLGGVVAGVAPLRSLVNIGTGVRDLVKVPIMEYRKDGRLVRSIKKGTQHFVKTSGSEVARLGAKLAIGTQTFLERTEEFLVGDPARPRQYAHLREGLSDDADGEAGAAAFSPYADQPLGVYNGLLQARRGLTRNLNEAKEAIMRVPSEAAQGGSAKGAAAAVFRAAPTAVIRPMIGVTEAVHKTLHGIDNTIDKEKREKIRDKYKKRSS